VLRDLVDFHVIIHEEAVIQPLNGQFAAIRLHFDVAAAERVACHPVTDDLYGMYHSEGEKKVGEVTGSGQSVQIANEDLHEIKFKMAIYTYEPKVGSACRSDYNTPHMRNTSKLLINFREC
jgi:hypothetical protein